MSKITDYPETKTLKENDVLLISNGSETNTITLRNLSYAIKSIIKYPEKIKSKRYSLV